MLEADALDLLCLFERTWTTLLHYRANCMMSDSKQ